MKKFTQEYIDTADKVRLNIYKDLVKEILDLAEKKLNKKNKELVVLDIGSSTGNISYELGKKVKKVVGVEPYKKTYLVSLKNNEQKNVKFYNCLIENFNTSLKFDLIIALTILEHMSNQDASLEKIFKLLKPNGLFYLTAPNKLWPYDYHHRLPFIMWMPLWMANVYVRISKKGESFKDSSYARTYFGVKKLFNKFSWKYEFFLPEENASYLGLGFVKDGSLEERLRKLGIRLIKIFPWMWIFSKGFIIIAKKI